jgi:hypothetical protein
MFTLKKRDKPAGDKGLGAPLSSTVSAGSPSPPPGGAAGASLTHSATDRHDEDEPMPDDATVDQMFEEAMEDMALRPAVRDAMRAFDKRKRWTIVQQNRKEHPIEDPNQWAEELEKRYMVADTYIQLRPVINASNKNWIGEFVQAGGLKNLMNAGRQLHFQHNDSGALLLPCLSCLNAFMNNEVGIEFLINDEQAIKDMTLWFDSKNVHVKTMVMKLLSVLAFMGYTKSILEAFTNLQAANGARLKPVVDFLREEHNVESRVCWFSHFLLILKLFFFRKLQWCSSMRPSIILMDWKKELALERSTLTWGLLMF